MFLTRNKNFPKLYQAASSTLPSLERKGLLRSRALGASHENCNQLKLIGRIFGQLMVSSSSALQDERGENRPDLRLGLFCGSPYPVSGPLAPKSKYVQLRSLPMHFACSPSC